MITKSDEEDVDRILDLLLEPYNGKECSEEEGPWKDGIYALHETLTRMVYNLKNGKNYYRVLDPEECLVECGDCGWWAEDTYAWGGQPLGYSGDCDDLYCPVCGSTDLEERVIEDPKDFPSESVSCSALCDYANCLIDVFCKNTPPNKYTLDKLLYKTPSEDSCDYRIVTVVFCKSRGFLYSFDTEPYVWDAISELNEKYPDPKGVISRSRFIIEEDRLHIIKPKNADYWTLQEALVDATDLLPTVLETKWKL